MEPYVYPGHDNRRYEPQRSTRRKYQGCAPTRGGKSKRLELLITGLVVFDLFCQVMSGMALVSAIFWWLGLGDSVLVLLFLILLIVAKL